MSNNSVQILFPVGRLVMGSLYEPQTKDANNQPLTVKTGPNAGQPTKKYFFAVAIPKEAGHQHWASTAWGAEIWKVGHAAFPQGQANAPSFAWKIDDGDSTVPNKKGRIPANTEGFPGCWVVSFSSTFAPKIYSADGSTPLEQPGVVKLGHFVEVFGSVQGNNNAQNPGVYMNHSMVAYAGYGPEIVRGPDPSAVGFGKGPLPPGASTVPQSALQPPAGVPGTSSPLGTPPAIPGTGAPSVPPPTPVTPHAGFMAPQPPGAAPAAPPAPPAAPAPAAAVWRGPAGTSQAQYAAAGWTEAQMRSQGLLG